VSSDNLIGLPSKRASAASASSAVHLFFLSCQWKQLGAIILVHLLLSGEALAQVAPNETYRTLKTEHFYIHFTPPLEDAARRAAIYAERAHARLKEHLTPARGPIDLILADNIDLANGSATPFPSNRIVVFASPPVYQNALRFTDDPLELVIVHELAHVFHLDRARGIWRLLQAIMGRAPFFFPNLYEPSWLVEGLAVYYESLITGGGRIEGSEHRMIAEAAALAHMFPRIDQLSLARPHFPYGESAYAFGSLFIDHLARAPRLRQELHRGVSQMGRLTRSPRASLGSPDAGMARSHRRWRVRQLSALAE
jgi:hypothetical protein